MIDVHPEIAQVALSKVEGSDFERFVNDFYPSLVGSEFQPLGGRHDGGADAFGGDPVHERVGSPTQFYQASVQQDSVTKIRHTIRRLKEYGRSLRTLTYVTSRDVPLLDEVETKLSDEFDVTVQIRDMKYLVSHMNDKPGGQAAFEHHLRHLTDYLAQVGRSSYLTSSKYVTDPTVFVFLRQETDRNRGNTELITSLTDTLIQWALEGTDPDNNVFMKEDAILEKIVEVLPAARREIEESITDRLKKLSSKAFPGGRRIHYWTRDNAYVLPLEARERVKEQNAGDEALALQVRQGLIVRAVANGAAELPTSEQELLGDIAMRTIQLLFERQGLLFSHFLNNDEPDPAEVSNLSDAAKEAIFEYNVSGVKAVEFAVICVKVARDSVYGSTENEREYLRRLARTYTLLFTLRNDLKVVEFFERMAREYNLLIGSDMIIRALSERCLESPDQLSRNTLMLSSTIGMRLILTEPVLDEVWWNIRNCDRQFHEMYEGIETTISTEIMQQIPQILIRTFFYNRNKPLGKNNWPAFIGMFLDYRSVQHRDSRTELKAYLMAAFSMEYLPRHVMQEMTDPDDVVEISSQLKDIKHSDYLATNDALMACTVFAERKRLGEEKAVNEFGHRTWWLTSESFILRTTKELVRKNDNARYMMRPEFLLNFLALAPSAEFIRTSYGQIFPTILGVNISRQMDEEAFQAIIEQVQEAQDMEPARRVAVIQRLNNEIMSDFAKTFGVSFEKIHRKPRAARRVVD